MTLDVHTLNQALLAGCGVLLVAILAVRGSVRVGMPSLLLYLLIGVGLGEPAACSSPTPSWPTRSASRRWW